MASNYGAGAGGSIIGKATPITSQIQKRINTGGGTGSATSKYMTPDQLYVDPTPAYQPGSRLLADTRKSCNRPLRCKRSKH